MYPQNTLGKHNEYATLVNSAAKLAVYVASGLLILKIIATYFTMSASIIASTSDTLMDIISSLCNFLILKFSLRPADHNHNFGHGKGESLAALIQSIITAIVAISIFIYAIHNIMYPKEISHFTIGIGITVISTIVTVILVTYQNKIIKITNSEAIKADSLHYKTDLLLNIVVLISLIFTYFAINYADSFFAIFIAIYIFKEALSIGIKSLNGLLDHILSQQDLEKITQLLDQQTNIIGYHDLKTRRSGHLKFIQFHLELDDNLSLLETHKITDQLELALMALFPHVEIFIHPEPTSIVTIGCEYRQINEQ